MKISSLIRNELGLNKNNRYPVVIIEGNSPPEIKGKKPYWTTPSGKTIVHHPSAYGWKTLYHKSTRRVEVGEEWLLNFKIGTY